MRPLVTDWHYALALFLVMVWAYGREFFLTIRTGKGAAGRQDAGSLFVALSAQWFAMSAAFAIAFTMPFGALAYRRFWFCCGLALLVAGSLLRQHCFRMLGRSFTAAVVVVKEQTIVERGAYRWIRHPSYTGGVLMYAGIALALGNWISLVVVLVMVLGSYLYRVHVEERALIETLGQPYREYMQRTRRFIPAVF